MPRLDRASLLAAALALLAVVAVIAIDLGGERDRRLAAMRRDVAVAAVVLGEATRGAQARVVEMAANPAAILAAANGEAQYFADRFDTMQASYPGMRALYATDRAGRTIGLVGDAPLRTPLELTRESPLCVGGHAYQIVFAPLARGLLSVAYDHALALQRARDATGGRVRLSLTERGTIGALAVDSIDPCGVLPDEPPYADAAVGGRAALFIEREGEEVAVVYEPIEGTALELLVQEDRARSLADAASRRLLFGAVGGLVLIAFLLGRWTARRPR